jgi:hypothetical protein
MALLLLTDLLQASRSYGLVPSNLTSSWLQIQLSAWGFAGLMIFGMGYVLIPSFIGRGLAYPWGALLHLPLAVASVILVSVSVAALRPELWRMAAALWLLGGILFAANLVATRKSALRPSVRVPKPSTLEDRAGLLLVGVAVGHLLASSVLFLQFDVSRGLGTLLPLDYWSQLHLYLLGFVVTMIFGVGYNLIPRFLAARPNRVLLYVNVAAALPAPTLFAVFISSGGAGLAVGAALFTTAFLSYALNVATMYRHRGREIQPTFAFILTTLVFLSAGISFGFLFILRPDLRYLAVIHAELNLFGFVGMTIFGVSYYIFPYFPKGSYVPSYGRPKSHLVMASAGLAIAVAAKTHRLLAGPGYPWLIVLGEGLMLISAIIYLSCMHRMLMAVWGVVSPGEG